MTQASRPEPGLPIEPLAIVGGCGRVGLPLGIAFALKGHHVDLVDLDADRVAKVNAGLMPFHEEGCDALLPGLVRSGLVRATTDSGVLAHARTAVVTIGTPVNIYHDPDVEQFVAAVSKLIQTARAGQLLVLRSTLSPGTTDFLARRLAELGRPDIDLAYCPERIAEDRALVELEQLPQLVAGTTPRAVERAAALFGTLSPKIIFLRPVDAELAKLFCNGYRYINFAIANQFYAIAQRFKGRFASIYQAVRDHYPRMQGFARPGLAAGPCLFKDTMQLGGFDHATSLLGNAAMITNEAMPSRIVEELKQNYPLPEMTVGILGMAFKPNSDDPRDSLSYKLRRVLLLECERVLCTDPYVRDQRLVPLEDVLGQADLIVIGTPHDCYRDLAFHQPVVDITGTLGGAPALAVFRPAAPDGMAEPVVLPVCQVS
jgi:UDP-N-acetyl-D-mannosaminuronic acid dehydrogenase